MYNITIVCFGKVKDSYNLVLCGLRKQKSKKTKKYVRLSVELIGLFLVFLLIKLS